MTEPLTIWGSGFRAGEPVVLILQIDGTSQRIIGGATGAQVTASAAGAFQISFDQIGGAAATIDRAINAQQPLAILGNGSDGSRASTAVTIVASRSSASSVAAVMSATAAEPGGETIVRGAGFQPGEAVTFVLAGGVSGTQDSIIGSGFPNASGAFETPVALSSSLAFGVYTIKAEVGGLNPVASAILIVADK